MRAYPNHAPPQGGRVAPLEGAAGDDRHDWNCCTAVSVRRLSSGRRLCARAGRPARGRAGKGALLKGRRALSPPGRYPSRGRASPGGSDCARRVSDTSA